MEMGRRPNQRINQHWDLLAKVRSASNFRFVHSASTRSVFAFVVDAIFDASVSEIG